MGAGIFQSNKATLDYKIKKYNKYVVLLIAVTCFLRLQSTFFYSVCVNIYNTQIHAGGVDAVITSASRDRVFRIGARSRVRAPAV